MFIATTYTLNHRLAKRPQQATPGSAAYDLFSAEVREEGNLLVVNTGLRTSFSSAFVMLVFGRSGLARKFGLSLANSVGVIDSDYRGDIQLMFRKHENMPIEEQLAALAPGNRVAQAMFLPLPLVEWRLTDMLADSERGTGGFGSTGSG